MKTAILPSVRVSPELRESAESVLQKGETLSSFVESALRASVEQRQLQREFIARGLVARDKAKETGNYIPASLVLDKLAEKLAVAKSTSRS